MHIELLIASMAFMAFLTASALLIMFFRRMAALKSGEIRVRQFKTYETESSMPEKLVQASRHYKNLFEMPVLFYVIALLALVLQSADAVTSSLALIYCLSRAIHTVIHVGVNNVFYRMYSFAGSAVILSLLWVYVIGKFFL